MPVTFVNPEVEAKYESLHVADPKIHLPGGKNKNGWGGNLSKITLAAADRLYERKNQNLLKLKEAKVVKQKSSANGSSDLKEA